LKKSWKKYAVGLVSGKCIVVSCMWWASGTESASSDSKDNAGSKD